MAPCEKVKFISNLHEDQHAIIWTEQFSDQQLEEFLLHAPSIDAILANEVHPQWFVQISRPLPGNLIQCILYEDTSSANQLLI